MVSLSSVVDCARDILVIMFPLFFFLFHCVRVFNYPPANQLPYHFLHSDGLLLHKQKTGMTTLPSQQQQYFVKTNNKTPGGPFSSSVVPYNQLQPPLPSQQPNQQQHHVMTQQQLYQHKNFQMQQQMFPQQQPYFGLNSLNSLPGPRPVCGVQPLKSSKLQKRIIGGDQAAFGEFPWQAHIRIAGFQCGGVLLNNQYIATAAHCVHR